MVFFYEWKDNTLNSFQVSVPISIKGRIILEILEGMVYLTERRVIHKDIKPGNILVDKDFHIKVNHTLRPHDKFVILAASII